MQYCFALYCPLHHQYCSMNHLFFVVAVCRLRHLHIDSASLQRLYHVDCHCHFIKEEKERHERLKEAYPNIDFSTDRLQRHLDFCEKKISEIHEEARHRRETYNIKLVNRKKQNKNASSKNTTENT